MTRVFLSYRRKDTEYIASIVEEACVHAYGRDSVYRDTGSIPPGADFTEWIEKRVEECDTMLVLIGDEWLSTTGRDGKRRLDDAGDWVRIEVERGLRRDGLQVIPVLVQGAVMPSSDELPESLRELVKRNAVVVTATSLRADIDRLLAAVRKNRIHLRLTDGDGKRIDPAGLFLFPRNDFVDEDHDSHRTEEDPDVFRIQVTPGEYELLVNTGDEGPLVRCTVLAFDGETHVAVACGSSSVVRVRVLDERGVPVDPDGLYVRDAERGFDYVTGYHGELEVEDGTRTYEVRVAPGAVQVHAHLDGRDTPVEELEVGAGETVETEIRFS